MNPHNFSIYACGVCGITMVVGSIWLVKSGIIKLSDATKGADGLSVDILKKVRISTTYPALALFVIGLLFVGVGVWFSRVDVVTVSDLPLAIVSKISGVDDSNLVTVTVQPDQFGSAVSFPADSNGQVDLRLPEIKRLTLTILANGYQPQPFTQTLYVDEAVKESGRRRLKMPEEVKFTKIASGPVTVEAPPAQGDIAPTPAGDTLQPFRTPATAVKSDRMGSTSANPDHLPQNH